MMMASNFLATALSLTTPPSSSCHRKQLWLEKACPISSMRIIKAGGGAVGGEGGGGVPPKYKGTQMREKQLTEMIEKKVVEAKEVCEGDQTSEECRVAWDEVEEVSQAKAHLRYKLLLEKKDPLEHFCQDNPETDECRIYED